MLHILLLILKILLIVIASILGLVIFLTLLILLAPIRYKVNSKLDEDIYVVTKVRYLMVSVKVIFDKNEKLVDTIIRIFGIRIGRKNSDGKKSTKKPKNKKKNHDDEFFEDSNDADDLDAKKPGANNLATDNMDVCASYDSSVSSLMGDDAGIDADVNSNIMISEEKSDTEDGSFDIFEDEVDDPDSKKSLWGKIKAFFLGIINKIKSLIELKNKKFEEFNNKIQEYKKKLVRLRKFWNMKCTVKTRQYLGKYLKGLVKHICPRKIKGYLRYGLKEPYKTGQITGYLSLIPLTYQKKFSLYPDFHNKIIEGDFEIKGKIVLGYIARIVFKPYIWKTVIKARQI